MARRRGIRTTDYLRKRTSFGGGTPKPDIAPRDTPTSLGIMRDHYLTYLGVRNYTEAGIQSKRDALNNLIEWAVDRDLRCVREITRPILESYQRWLWRYRKADGKPLGVATQCSRLGAMKEWFKWMVRQNVLPANPASEIEYPRAERRLPTEALTLQQMDAVLRVPDVSDPLGVRDRTILEVFYSTGVRRLELCRLELADVNQQRRTVRVRQGKGRKDRIIPIGARALIWVERYLTEVRPRLVLDTREKGFFLTSYGSGFDPDTVSRMVATWIKIADIGRTGSCHLLRHTCATHMLEGGADIRYIQQLLGHEKLETTAIYTEVNIRQLQEVHARCHPSGGVE